MADTTPRPAADHTSPPPAGHVVVRERTLDDRVQDDALKHVVANLAPLQVLLLPLSLLVAAVMRNDVSEQRLSIWVATAIAATIVVIITCTWVRSHPVVDRTTHVLAATALMSVGAVAGLSTWVAAESALDVEMMFTLFPAVSLAVGTIVCAGRRDMFLAYSIPLTATAAIGLVSTGDTRMQIGRASCRERV